MLSLGLFELLLNIFDLHIQELNFLVTHCHLFLRIMTTLQQLLLTVLESSFEIVDCLFLERELSLGLL